MAVAVLVEFEGGAAGYDAVNEKMGMTGLAEGQQLHTAGEIADGKMRVYDVWDSEDAYTTFREGTLVPAIREAMGPDTAPPSKEEIYELHMVGIP
jgi:hypothetical protein